MFAPFTFPPLLFYSPSAVFLSLGMCRVDLVLQPALARTGRSLTRNCHGETRSDLRKMNLIYCQIKQFWMVGNRDKVRATPASAPLLFFPGAASPFPSQFLCPPQPQPGTPQARCSQGCSSVFTPAFHRAFPFPSLPGRFALSQGFPQRC